MVIASYFHPQVSSDLILKLKQMASHVPMVLIGDLKKTSAPIHGADAFLDRSISSAELLERVKIMSARKRGPRPARSFVTQPLACPA